LGEEENPHTTMHPETTTQDCGSAAGWMGKGEGDEEELTRNLA
jgi:hypothetical protein